MRWVELKDGSFVNLAYYQKINVKMAQDTSYYVDIDGNIWRNGFKSRKDAARWLQKELTHNNAEANATLLRNMILISRKKPSTTANLLNEWLADSSI